MDSDDGRYWTEVDVSEDADPGGDGAVSVWDRLVPEGQARVAGWLVATVAVGGIAIHLSQWVEALLALQSPGAMYVIGPGARVLVIVCFLWLALERYRAPAVIAGFVLLSSVAQVVESVFGLVLRSALSLLDSPSTELWPGSSIELFLKSNGQSLAIVLIALLALVAMWKREQLLVSSEASPAAQGAWRRAVERFGTAIGLGGDTEPVARRLLMAVVGVQFCTVILQQLLNLPANLAFQLAREWPFADALSMSGPVVALLLVAWIAFGRLDMPRAAWLPLSIPSVLGIVAIPVASLLQGVRGDDPLAYARSMSGFAAMLAMQIAVLVAVVWWTSSPGRRPSEQALPAGGGKLEQ